MMKESEKKKKKVTYIEETENLKQLLWDIICP